MGWIGTRVYCGGLEVLYHVTEQTGRISVVRWRLCRGCWMLEIAGTCDSCDGRLGGCRYSNLTAFICALGCLYGASTGSLQCKGVGVSLSAYGSG